MKRALLAVLSAVCLPALNVLAQSTEATPDFAPKKLMGPRRAIVNPSILPAQRVRNQVSDDELVLGVLVNGQARAYPINMLTGPSREIINDVLGRMPIAATW